MDIWIEGKRYELDTMPDEILASCLRKRIKIDYEDSWLPETTRKEGYALLNEAARRLLKGVNVASKCNSLAELAELMNTKVELAPINADGIVVLNTEQFEAYKKAMRIVAELAKASDAIGYADEFVKDGCKECIYIPATQQLCVKTILNCRAIAEEGSNNGNG